jgi:ankyrin repeat protein
MNVLWKSSNLVIALAMCFGANVYTDVYAENLPQSIEPIPAKAKQIELVQAIKKNVQQPKTKQNLNAQLLIAAQNGNLKEVRSLISQATDVNVRDEYGWTPLLWAAMNGHTDIVRVLLVSGANPNTRNKYGWTPLMWAAGQGYGEIVRSLIASGARLNAQDRNGWTAIMWAWDGKQEETVAILRSATRE